MRTLTLKPRAAFAASRASLATVPPLQRANLAVRAILRAPRVQPKLTIGAVNDPAEREADQVADQVMRMPESDLAMVAAGAAAGAAGDGASPPFVRRKCAACAAEAEQHDDADQMPAAVRLASPQRQVQRLCAECEDELHRKESGDESGLAAPAVEAAVGTLGGGTPLPAAERAFFEPRFSYDFGRVRIHEDAKAAQSARAVNALAYTLGPHIVFGGGNFAPRTSAGRKLLAHELTHVIQQQPERIRLQPDQSNAHISAETSSNVLRRLDDSELEALPVTPSSQQSAAATEGAQQDDTQEPACPRTPTGLGYKDPPQPCSTAPSEDIGLKGMHFHFCKDSDVLAATTPADVKAMAAGQTSESEFLVHGYASRDGDPAYNVKLACHRANRLAKLLIEAGVTSEQIEIVSRGPTKEFPGGPDANRVAVVLARIKPERRFGGSRPDPKCPQTPTGLGDVAPDPACPATERDIGQECKALDEDQAGEQCDRFLFCLDSDVFADPATPASVLTFARGQPAKAFFVVHGYASTEGPAAYNMNLSCHRAIRVARELMRVGVPSEQIEVAGKGETKQFGAGAEPNRAVAVRAMPPTVSPQPASATADTPAKKHAIIDQAIGRIDEGDYRLAADAYTSFWTCGRVPTVRQAVKTTSFLVEGDPGVAPVPLIPNTIVLGPILGAGTNAVVVSDDVFAQSRQMECVQHALMHQSFHHKVDAPDFGPGHSSGSDRFEAAEFLVQLADIGCVAGTREDPRKDKPAPACFQAPARTFKGVAQPGEAGAKVPRFVVEESGVNTNSGDTQFTMDTQSNQAFMSSSVLPFFASATVTLHDQPREFANYDVGYLVTIMEDETTANYAGPRQAKIILPTPIRDTDGRTPAEPWFADDAFQTTSGGTASPAMFKAMVQPMPMNLEHVAGDASKPRSALRSAVRHAQYQVWLVARRHGAPLDRFSTHFLDGTIVNVDQDMDMSQDKAVGRSVARVGFGTNPGAMRFRGTLPEDLGPRETMRSDTAPNCNNAFIGVAFDPITQRGQSVMDAAQPQNLRVKAAIDATKPTNYQPAIKINATGNLGADQFEAGLIQNILSNDEGAEYSTGEVTHVTLPRVPLKDGAGPNDPTFDETFMSKDSNNQQRFSAGSTVHLDLGDLPRTDAFMNLALVPGCMGKRSGTLTKLFMRSEFRAWVAVRFRGDPGCIRALQHIDWHTDYLLTLDPTTQQATDFSGAHVVTEPGGDGSPPFVVGAPVANDVQHDDVCD